MSMERDFEVSGYFMLEGKEMTSQQKDMLFDLFADDFKLTKFEDSFSVTGYN